MDFIAPSYSAPACDNRRMRKALLPLLCLTCLAADESWTRFRGPNGSGISGDSGYPTVFGKDKNVRWRVPVRPGKSSPVLTREHIFLTAAETGKLYTQCFDRKTGKLAWERSLDRPHTEAANGLNHEAGITPVTDGSNVYSFFKDYGLVAYDANGKLLWKTPLGPFHNSQGLGASPILVGNSVLLLIDQADNSFLASFAKASGEMQWKIPRAEFESWGTPLLYAKPGEAQGIVTASCGRFGVHMAADGRRAVDLTGLAAAMVSSPVLDGNIVYAFGYAANLSAFSITLDKFDKNKDGKLTPDEYGTNALLSGIGWHTGNRDGVVTVDEWDLFAKTYSGPNRMTAVRLESGGARELWHVDRNFAGVIPTLLAYQDVLFLVRNGGILTTHDAATGNLIKTARIEGALGGYSASPVGAEGKVWLASEEGKVSVVRAAGQWEVLAVNDLGEGCYATPALSGGVIYLRTEQALYAFGK
jgi:outer membrane protein assembly factor BamB